MKIVQYKTYGFRLGVEDEKPILVCAPTMIEAMRIFSVMHKDDPHDVIHLGDVYLSNCD